MRRASLAALTLAATAGIPPAPAQDVGEEEQATLTATISQSLVADSNYGLDDPSPGTSTYGDTRFVLDYLRDTRSRSLGLGIDTGLRAIDEATDDETDDEETSAFRVATPSRAYLTYLQEGPHTAFDSTFRLRSRQVDYNVFDEDDTDGDLTVLRGDTREQRADADVGLVVGVDAPSSTEFRLTATNIDYTNTEEGDNLTPRYTLAGEALWTLRLTSVFSAALFGSYSYYNADNPEKDEIRVAEADAGLVYEPSETLRIRGGLGYADRVHEETNPRTDVRESENDSGPTLRGDFRYILPSLTLRGDLRITTAAPQTRLSGNLNLLYNLPRGRVIGRVFQRYGGSQTGSDSRVTGAGVGLVRDLNTLSRVEFDASYAVQVDEDEDPGEVPEPDIERTDLTASYVYDLTDTVSAELGYGYRHRIEDPDDADSHRVFVVLGKTFETGL
jgi:hypothetical protein